MTSELMSLTWLVAFSTIMWIPYVLNRIALRGLIDTVGYPENPPPPAAWAKRSKAAHYNAIENLILFAALVLIANAANISTATTVLACQLYFWARVVHYLAHSFGIPWVRTIAFAAGWGCQIALLIELI